MERNFTVGFGSRRGLLRAGETAILGSANAKQRPFVPRAVNDITCNGECAIIPFCVARLSNTIEDARRRSPGESSSSHGTLTFLYPKFSPRPAELTRRERATPADKREYPYGICPCRAASNGALVIDNESSDSRSSRSSNDRRNDRATMIRRRESREETRREYYF